MAISTHGFDNEYDRHGFVLFGAIVLSIFGLGTVVAGFLTKISKLGFYFGALLFICAMVFLFKAFRLI